MDSSAKRLIDWSAAARTMPGQSEAGDRAWVKVEAMSARLAVVDGIGHGPEAARAAQAVISTLEEHASDPLPDLLRRCHDRMRFTRGAVMSLAAFDGVENTMSWVGIGNVDGLLIRSGNPPARAREMLVQAAGVLGDGRVQVKAQVHGVSAGDLVILTTDGIRPIFSDLEGLKGSPRSIADRILDNCARPNDDALVLVARYGHGKGKSKTR